MEDYINSLYVYFMGSPMDTNPYGKANEIADWLKEEELIRQGCQELGISVADSEIDKTMQEYKDHGIPDNEAFRNYVVGALRWDKLMEHFGSLLPDTMEQVNMQVIFTESERKATEVEARIEAGDDFAALLREFSYRYDAEDESSTDPVWYLRELLPESVADVFDLEYGQASEPLYDETGIKSFGYWLIEVIDRDEEKGVDVRVMLLSSMEEAEEIKARLDSGEDFAALAREHSQLTGVEENGGEIGWIEQDMVSEVFYEAATALSIGEVSQPVKDEAVQTRGEYWIVKVLGRDSDREMEEDTTEFLKWKRYSDWMQSLKGDSIVENYLDREKQLWAVNEAYERVKRDIGY
jgi:parvulin-like peptidyl-prolyl isomerase